MKFGAVNNYKNKIEDEVRWIHSKGFDYIDMTFEPVFSSKIKIGSIKKALQETGLGVIGHISPSLPLAFPLKSIRKAAWEELTKYADLFKELEIKYVTLHPSLQMPLVDIEKKFKYNREMVKKADKIIRDRGMTLILESFFYPFDTPGAFERLLDGLDRVMVHIDIGHCNLAGRNLSGGKDTTEDFFKKFGSRIVHLHFSDNYGKYDSHKAIGDGNIDWERIIEILNDYGYDSTITLEVFTDDRKHLIQSRNKIKEIINKVKKR
ncbi:MAG: sugar phosphate isomerase/epimerase [Elusimicrobia bacterium]|jgi:sugar phosphate isomerase/epimerase|nr:sugar phosphate isomerase/epimerase [Elusimicrobiota bacterium]